MVNPADIIFFLFIDIAELSNIRWTMNHNDEGAKIFVGGIGETGEEELRGYFAQYGTVKAVQVKYDPNTQRARGFGFIIFEDMSSVDQVWTIWPPCFVGFPV